MSVRGSGLSNGSQTGHCHLTRFCPHFELNFPRIDCLDTCIFLCIFERNEPKLIVFFAQLTRQRVVGVGVLGRPNATP